MSTRTYATLATSILALAACTTPAGPGPDDATVADAFIPPDAATTPDAASGFVLYARCNTAADCHGDADVICNDIFPGGMCTRPCTEDGECGEDACWNGYCRPTCTAGGLECAQWQGSCVRDPSATRNRCTPACDTAAPLPDGELACNEGLVCSPRAYCVEPSMLPGGAANGSPCETAEDCIGGGCWAEVEDGIPTGRLGGLCYSAGVQPPDSAFVTGEPSPRSNCPEGSVVLPADAQTFAGDVTLCFDECAADTDCRAGYFCQRWAGTAASPMLSTGVCWPVFCDIPGMDCPSGTACRTRGGVAHCERT